MRLQLLPECIRQRHRVVAARELLPGLRKPELHGVEEVSSRAMPHFGLAPLLTGPEKDCAPEYASKGFDQSPVVSAIRGQAPLDKQLSSAPKSNLAGLVPNGLCR